jgi:hypothetical protein
MDEYKQYNIFSGLVKRKKDSYWDVQGTSYPPPEDKMYDSSVLPAAKEDG